MKTLPLFTLLLCGALTARDLSVPSLNDLPLQSEISQGGITWNFEEPVPVGRFVNGDYYVVGSATITNISPRPILDRGNTKNCRNVSILNPPTDQRNVSYDGRTMNGNRFNIDDAATLPIRIRPGDSLVSSISAEGREGKCFMNIRRMNSFTRTFSVLTCLDKPVAPDAFRPGIYDRQGNLYYARDLQWPLLKSLPKVEDTPDITHWTQVFRQPWAGATRLSIANAQDYQPQYSAESARAEGIVTLLLNLDFKKSEKEPLLINFVQYGIDRYSLIRNGGLTDRWKAVGGHGNGEKWGITFAGLMLGDEDMAHLNKSHPKVLFGQDQQTAFVKDMPAGMQDSWMGSDVVYTGMHGLRYGEPGGRLPEHLPYEHQHPKDWVPSTYKYPWLPKPRTQFAGEVYRRSQNSPSWVGVALAIRIMEAEDAYGHPAFTAYVDRWMTIDDAPLREIIKENMHPNDNTDYEKMPAGRSLDPFAESMWEAYRNN